MPAWELDFWGRFRRAVEVADAELDASIENYDDVLVLLLAEVASSYVEMRTFQERLSYAVKNVASQENSLRIAEDKLRQGAATQRDVEQARTVLEQTRALVPQFEEGERLANNRLCVLLGLPPQDLVAMGLGEASVPQTPPEVAVGIPADLVRRRPDVRRSEREVAAQSARIGIAESDLYPHISINGTFGVAAARFRRTSSTETAAPLAESARRSAGTCSTTAALSTMSGRRTRGSSRRLTLTRRKCWRPPGRRRTGS